MNNPNCDGNGPHSVGEVRVLATSEMSNAILCRQCFEKEIAWRKSRNTSRLNPVCEKFELPTWDSLEVYANT